MINIQLTKKPFASIFFDGMVLEYFAEHNDTGRRYDVRLIQSIEITTDKKDMHYLKVNTNRVSLTQEMDAEAVAQARQLAAEVQKAMGSS